MVRLLLTDDEWELIADVFPEPAATGRPPRDARTVLDGILWVLRTGSPWRDLPEEFGAWKTAWRMFDTWTADGTLAEILHRLPSSVCRGGRDRPSVVVHRWHDGAGGTVALPAVGKKRPARASRPRFRPFAWGFYHENPYPVRWEWTPAPLPSDGWGNPRIVRDRRTACGGR